MNTYQAYDPQGARCSVTSRKLNGQQFQSNLPVAADGFEVWWKKTFELHTAVVAQATALMREHRSIRSAASFQGRKSVPIANSSL